MAGSTRYLRYIVFAFVALIVIFFISSSSQQVPDYETAKGMFKGQGWSQTSPDTPAAEKEQAAPVAPAAPVAAQPSPVGDNAQATSDTGTSPNPFTSSSPKLVSSPPGERMNATFVTLARNSDVWEIARSIRQVEDRFNRGYNYDWVFLNDDDFDDTFKKVTTALMPSAIAPSTPPKNQLSLPSSWTQSRASFSRRWRSVVSCRPRARTEPMLRNMGTSLPHRLGAVETDPPHHPPRAPAGAG